MAAATKGPSAVSLELWQQDTHHLAWWQQPRDHQLCPWSSGSRTLTIWHGSSNQGTVSCVPGAQAAGHSPTGMAAATKGLSAVSLELRQQDTHQLAWQQQPRDRQLCPWSSGSRTLTHWHGSSNQGTVSCVSGAQLAEHLHPDMAVAAKGSDVSLDLRWQDTHPLMWQ
ncbi:hypothetical protein FRB95_014188 [Tulasnella sp. JGI-2019a]|nr:hypothetical protein FRB95_014188 [Tulasnella sp. JGI-2019a]